MASQTAARLANPYLPEAQREVEQYRERLISSGVAVGPKELTVEQGDFSKWQLALSSSPFSNMLLTHTNLVVGGGDESPLPRSFRVAHRLDVALSAEGAPDTDKWAGGFKVKMKVHWRIPLILPVAKAQWSGNDCRSGLVNIWRRRFAKLPSPHGLAISYAAKRNAWQLRISGNAPTLTLEELSGYESIVADLTTHHIGSLSEPGRD
jgi:hypothetical protein